MNEQKVLSFIDRIEADKQQKVQDTEFTNSIEYKYKCLNKAKEDCKKHCLAKIFEKFYRNAVPLNDEYKTAYCDDLKSDIPGFVKSRGYNDLVYYVGEAMKKSPAACKVMEAVEGIVESTFQEKEMNLSDYTADDLVFKSDDILETKINVTAQDLNLDDLAEVIKDNVKTTALAEITRAKREKDNVKAIEAELANDLSITNEAAIEFALELRGLKDTKVFQPSLFEGIMIGKMEKASLMAESTNPSVYLYNTLVEYGMPENNSFASPAEIAFVESVREYTLLNITKALKLESFSLNDIRELAQEYAAK